MSARRILAIAATSAIAVGGAGAAIAAVSKDDPKKTEDAVLADAAKRLNVAPDKLRDALKAAQDAQLDKRLDEAVKNGDLTRKQADEIKQRHESGPVLGPGGPPPGGHFGGPGKRGHFGPGPGGPGPGGGPGAGLFGDLAKALDLKQSELITRLRKGDSIATIAKAQGKSLDSVRSSVKAAAKARADKAVKAGDLTRKQADSLLSHLDEHLKNLGRGPRMHFRFRGRHDRGMPPPNVRPGSAAPEPAPPVPADQYIR